MESKTIPVVFDSFSAYDSEIAIELLQAKKTQIKNARLFNNRVAIEIMHSFNNYLWISQNDFYNQETGLMVADCLIVADFELDRKTNQQKYGINLPCDRGLLIKNVTFADFGNGNYAIAKAK